MKLAAKIDDALEAQGISKKEFADKLGKSPSEISKWLGGTHNFTTSTLIDIEAALGIQLIDLEPLRVNIKIPLMGYLLEGIDYSRLDTLIQIGQNLRAISGYEKNVYSYPKWEVHTKANSQQSLSINLGEAIMSYPS